MAITLVCRSCEEFTFSCCGGGSSTEFFKGLEIDEDGAITRIYYPFDVVYTNVLAVVSDLKGNTFTIPLAETSYPDMAALKAAVNGCLCPTSESGGGTGNGSTSGGSCGCCDELANGFSQVFLNQTGPTVTFTAAPLPSTEQIPYLLEVLRDGGKSISGVHFVADPGTGVIDFTAGTEPRTLEGENIQVIKKGCTNAVYQNFLAASGDYVELTVSTLGSVLATWETEQFLNLNATNEVTIANGPLPMGGVTHNLYVLRDGGKAIAGTNFVIDYNNNKLVFTRAFENENLVVRYRPDNNTNSPKNIRVYRDGGEGILGVHHTIDYETNRVYFTRALEVENVQVYIG